MIEKDAKETRCCGPEGCGALLQREPNVGRLTRWCIGSDCMAWRKTGAAKVENRQGKLVDKDEDGTGRWHYDGYCGLAGIRS